MTEKSVAIGDPQAPLETFLEVLATKSLLGDDGRLARGVHLVAMGDYFDWGTRADRDRAARSGRQLLEWLAGHTPAQVTILLGNHDLARVGELAHFDDVSFAAARTEADSAYFDHAPLRPESMFSAATGVASWEMLARDFSTFEVAQRTLVMRLLREERFEVAYAAGSDLLLSHAGVTTRELGVLGVDATDASHSAPAIAAALRERLRDAVRAWKDGPLTLAGLHEPGDATREGGGMFYHRPEVPQAKRPDAAEAPLRRRYDVATLPKGLGQAIGHIRDAKCRSLLGAPPREPSEREGALHYAVINESACAYRTGTPAAFPADAATLIFLDGGMHHTLPQSYELYDLSART